MGRFRFDKHTSVWIGSGGPIVILRLSAFVHDINRLPSKPPARHWFYVSPTDTYPRGHFRMVSISLLETNRVRVRVRMVRVRVSEEVVSYTCRSWIDCRWSSEVCNDYNIRAR